jgi:hypothetical protein
MRRLTVHDVLGTIEGLQTYSQALREAATTKVHDIGDYGTGVLADPVSLAEIAAWMSGAADELRMLIPNGPLAAFEDKRRTRTLVRFIGYDGKTGNAQAVLPGWSPDVILTIEDITLEVGEFLGSVKPETDTPARLHAWVNLGASAAAELVFDDWELP